MHKCQNCGTEFEGKFCPECGTFYSAPLNEPTEPTFPDRSSEEWSSTFSEEVPTALPNPEPLPLAQEEGIPPLPAVEGAQNDFSFRIGKKTVSHEKTVQIHNVLSLLGPLMAGFGMLFIFIISTIVPLQSWDYYASLPYYDWHWMWWYQSSVHYLFGQNDIGSFPFNASHNIAYLIHLCSIGLAALALLFRYAPKLKTVGIPLGKKRKLFLSDLLSLLIVLLIPVTMGLAIYNFNREIYQYDILKYFGGQFYVAAMLTLFFICLFLVLFALCLHLKFPALFSDENARKKILPADSNFPAPENKPKYNGQTTKLTKRVRNFANNKLRILVFGWITILLQTFVWINLYETIGGSYRSLNFYLSIFPYLFAIIVCLFWCISLRKRPPKPEAALGRSGLIALAIFSLLNLFYSIVFVAILMRNPHMVDSYLTMIILGVMAVVFFLFFVLAAAFASKAKSIARQVYGTTAPVHIFAFEGQAQTDFADYARYRTELAAWKRSRQEKEKEKEKEDESELISSSLSKSKRLRWTLFFIMAGYYVVMFLLGAIGTFTPAFDGMMGAIFKTDTAIGHAYSQMIFLTLFLLSFTFPLYLAVKAPFYIRKRWKRTLFFGGIALALVLHGVYMGVGVVARDGFLNVILDRSQGGLGIVTNGFSSRYLYLIGAICFIVVYSIGWRAQRKAILPKGKFERLKKLSESKAMSAAKLYDIWYYLATVLFTYLLYPLVWVVVVIVAMILIVVVTLIVTAIAVGGGGSGSGSSYGGSDEIVIRNEYGQEVNLQKTSRKEQLEQNGTREWYTCYRSETSDTWYSKDGKHFFRKE